MRWQSAGSTATSGRRFRGDDVGAPHHQELSRSTATWQGRHVAYDRLLVAIDFSEDSLAALASVRELARRLGGELVLLHVSEAADVVPGSDLAKDDRAHWQAELDAEAAQLRAAGLRARAIVRPGYPVAEGIVEAAREERADMIVMGSPGRSGLAERLLGGITDAVIGTAPCPVLVMSRSRSDAG